MAQLAPQILIDLLHGEIPVSHAVSRRLPVPEKDVDGESIGEQVDSVDFQEVFGSLEILGVASRIRRDAALDVVLLVVTLI